jgi:hypothetical protein
MGHHDHYDHILLFFVAEAFSPQLRSVDLFGTLWLMAPNL